MDLFSILLLLLLPILIATANAQSTLCRSTCGNINISYPFSIDDGCGSPRYRNLLSCPPSSSHLLLRTPSGSYPVRSLSYSSDPHLIISDPSMLSCRNNVIDTQTYSAISPTFSLDTSTPLALSSKNDFLFFNCSPSSVIVSPKPAFCTRFPERCGSACDSAGYLCRNLPGCPDAVAAGESGTRCCSYYPTSSESVRMMLRHCRGYASLYWRAVGDGGGPYDEVAEYGVRVDFEIPVTTRCRQCRERGGGVCGFDTETRGFLCLCEEGNVTSYCGDGSSRHGASVGVIAGTTTVVSAAGLAGAGALIWYLRKTRTSKVTCGVQTNENRLF